METLGAYDKGVLHLIKVMQLATGSGHVLQLETPEGFTYLIPARGADFKSGAGV